VDSFYEAPVAVYLSVPVFGGSVSYCETRIDQARRCGRLLTVTASAVDDADIEFVHRLVTVASQAALPYVSVTAWPTDRRATVHPSPKLTRPL
jgi:hypothetical protein